MHLLCCAVLCCAVLYAVLQVKLLVEQVGASLSTVDRFGHTPLDEASHAGAADVVNYLSTPAGVSLEVHRF